jgi:retron-type reverse transcriptase
VNAELLMHGWHGLNKGAASGVDGLTAEIQAANLEGNVADLAERVKAERYRAKLVRRVYIQPDTGAPQGGIVSPVLANVYLHQVLDLWFERVVKPRCRGEALLYRYADDFVCAIGAAASARALPGRSSTAPWRGAASRSPASPRSQ